MKRLHAAALAALLAPGLAFALLAAAPATAATAAELPQAFDLRDPNGDGDRADSVVTPVKQQDPWNSCWAFASTAAAETSILSKMGATAQATGLDLSERGVALASYTRVDQAVSASQAGEGFAGDANAGMNAGGKPYFAIVSFSAGLGPIAESALPYQNNEGLITCSVLAADAERPQTLNLTKSQIDAYDKTATVTPLHYAGTADGSDGTTWGAGSALWARAGYELIDGNVLPALRQAGGGDEDEGEGDVTEATGAVTLNPQGFAAVKSELLAGRAVAMTYNHDEALYLDKDTWSYCSYGSSGGSHAACIVGWDDGYAAANFKTGENGEKPAGDGAWLVKNSFGAQTEEFPNAGDWGIVEDGENTGYFWLSYYDASVGDLVSFDFDLARQNSDADLRLDQYDFLPDEGFEATPYDDPTSSANVFTAQVDTLLRALGATVYQAKTTVTYQVFLLDGEAKTPTEAGHSSLAYAATETYEYAGYHRLEIPEDARVALRAGQRYAVVITQRGADGKYYQGAATTYKSSGFVAKVGVGESWTGTGGAGGGADEKVVWTDWRETLDDPDGEGGGAQTDNFSIKGISSARDWASVDELTALEQAVDRAEATLAAAKVSADGLDVAPDATWLTQDEYDALAAAAQDARAALTAAGENYRTALANTTPTSAEVTALTASLAVTGRPGAMAEASDQAKPVAGTPSTGDSTGGAASVGLLAALGSLALLAAPARGMKRPS